MLRQDKFIVGLLMGIFVPVMFFFVFRETNHLVAEYIFKRGSGFTERFVAILSVCTNLLPFIIFEKARKDHALRGVIGATFVLAFFIVFYYFRKEIF